MAILNLIETQHQYRHVHDRMGQADKDKLRKLAHELVAEAKYKIHQTDGLRNECSRHNGFQFGMIIGQIREKYRSMLETYRLTKNKYYNISRLILPHVERWKPIHYFMRMEYITSLEFDIDRLINVLETSDTFKTGPF